MAKDKNVRADYIAPGSEQHAAVIGYADADEKRKAELDKCLAQKTLIWVGREDKKPIGRWTVPGVPLIEGFRRRKPS